MIQSRLPYTSPPNDTKIWRYLELPALVHLLSKKTLHFTRPDKFTDRFEGSLSRSAWEAKIGIAHPDIIDEYREVRWREDRRTYAVNCWHMSEYESLAMWSLYGRSVALETSFGRLIEGTKSPYAVSAGAVEYIDYERDEIPLQFAHAQYFRKRKSFAHERELRLIVSKHSSKFASSGGELIDEKEFAAGPVPRSQFSYRCGDVPESGLDVPIDPSVLIQTIYVAPEAADWIREAVTTVVTSLGYSFPVKRSDLDASPIY